MGKWAVWYKIDKELQTAWEKDGPGYRAQIGYHVFRLYKSDNEWIWEISELETGYYCSGTTTSKQTALEDINFQLTLLYW